MSSTDPRTTAAPGENWARTHRYAAAALHRPGSVAELQRLVAAAPRVRALGTRHCFTDVADSPGDLVTLEGLPVEVDVDLAAGAVRASAGTTYAALAPALHAAGAGLAAMASLPHISLAGGVATATHGSGDRTRNLAAAVRAVELVGPDGQLRRVERGAEDFAGSVVALGALGVVTHLELDVEPTYEVRQHVFSGLSFDAFTAHLDEVTSAAHSVSVYTTWTGEDTAQVWLKSRVDAGEPPTELFGARRATRPLHPLPEVDVRNATEQLGVPGPWHERLPHFRAEFTPSNGEEVQAEYLLPREHALDAVAALREVGPRIAPLLHMSEVRTVAADDLWLSSAHGRDVLAVHFTFRHDAATPLARVRGAVADVEAALAGLGARPHWGKLFTLGADALADLHPRWDDARALVARHDPDRVFANAFTDRVGLTG